MAPSLNLADVDDIDEEHIVRDSPVGTAHGLAFEVQMKRPTGAHPPSPVQARLESSCIADAAKQQQQQEHSGAESETSQEVQEPMLVRVLSGLSGDVVCSFQLGNTDYVSDLKHAICAHEGTPAVAQRLMIAGGRLLNNWETLGAAATFCPDKAVDDSIGGHTFNVSLLRLKPARRPQHRSTLLAQRAQQRNNKTREAVAKARLQTSMSAQTLRDAIAKDQAAATARREAILQSAVQRTGSTEVKVRQQQLSVEEAASRQQRWLEKHSRVEQASEKYRDSLANRSSRAGQHFDNVMRKAGHCKQRSAQQAADYQRRFEEAQLRRYAQRAACVARRQVHAKRHNAAVSEKVYMQRQRRQQRSEELRARLLRKSGSRVNGCVRQYTLPEPPTVWSTPTATGHCIKQHEDSCEGPPNKDDDKISCGVVGCCWSHLQFGRLRQQWDAASRNVRTVATARSTKLITRSLVALLVVAATGIWTLHRACQL